MSAKRVDVFYAFAREVHAQTGDCGVSFCLRVFFDNGICFSLLFG